jgi:SpoVK/Ycf46/Vps4 family AAA+-type ATPase
MEKKPVPKKPVNNIKPAKSYLDSLSDFAGLLGTIGQAEKAARELNRELDKAVPPGAAPPKTQSATAAPVTVPEPEAPKEPEPTVDELLAKLDELVGLKTIKDSVRSLINLVKVRKLREQEGLQIPPMSLHMVFTGNPGTGKTTVARIMAGLYKAIGVLSKGHLIETDRGGLVAGFVGQTAIKTGDVVKSALGGILFIDEAYALAPADAGNDFGREAIETLLKLMEDNRDDLVVIVAGYDDLMERFISSNPGLESRFNRYFAFPDYNAAELSEIFTGLCKKHEYTLADGAAEKIKEILDTMYATRDGNFGNARDVRNLFEDIVAVHADRVSALETPTRDQLASVIAADIEKLTEDLSNLL